MAEGSRIVGLGHFAYREPENAAYRTCVARWGAAASGGHRPASTPHRRRDLAQARRGKQEHATAQPQESRAASRARIDTRGGVAASCPRERESPTQRAAREQQHDADVFGHLLLLEAARALDPTVARGAFTPAVPGRTGPVDRTTPAGGTPRICARRASGTPAGSAVDYVESA
jgi:hypothetical protein